MASRPPPDETAQYTDPDTGRPSKDFFNWIRWLSRTALFSPVGGGAGVPSFSVLRAAGNQLGVPNGSLTQITFDTVLTNVGGYYAGSVWRPPPGRVHLNAGFYARATLPATMPAGNFCAIYLTKNGPTAFTRQALNTENGSFAQGYIAANLECNGTDTFGVACYLTISGGTGEINGNDPFSTWFSGHWIGP